MKGMGFEGILKFWFILKCAEEICVIYAATFP